MRFSGLDWLQVAETLVDWQFWTKPWSVTAVFLFPFLRGRVRVDGLFICHMLIGRCHVILYVS